KAGMLAKDGLCKTFSSEAVGLIPFADAAHMLSVLNQYAYGYVAIPVIVSSQRAGLFHALGAEPATPFAQLVQSLRANSGHLRVALRLLQRSSCRATPRIS